MPVRTYVIGKTKRVLIEPPVIACVQTVERIISRIGLVTAIIMLPLMIATRTYEIVMRKVFNAPSSVLQYVEWEAFSLLILLTLGFAYVKNSHVRVDVMRDRFGPRVRAWIEIYGFAFLALPLAGIVIVHGGEYAYAAFEDKERSALALFLPLRWLIKGALPFGIFLLALAMLCAAIRNVRYLFWGPGGPAPD